MAMFANRLLQRPMQRFGQSQIGRGLEMFNTVADHRSNQENAGLMGQGNFGQAAANMGESLAYGAALGPFGNLAQMGVNAMGGFGGLFGGGNQNR